MIWLTGNKGQLGSEIEKNLKGGSFSFFASDKEIDISDSNLVRKTIGTKPVKWIVNCAAYAQVDKAESCREEAFKVNTYALANLAELAQKYRIKIIHFSTDYVFDGKKNKPYEETDKPFPLSVYGESKLRGENILREKGVAYYIIRTAGLFGSRGSNLAKKIIAQLKEKKKIKAINDSYGSTTYVKDLAQAVLEIINKEPDFGIYHFTNSGQVTPYIVASEVYSLLKERFTAKNGIVIEPVSFENLRFPAKRPRYSVLCNEKISLALGIEIRNWKHALREFIKEIAL